jgi:hypothetical protein
MSQEQKEQKRKNIEKLKAQFFRCKASQEEQIDAAIEILGDLLTGSNYNKIYNKLGQIGILTLKLNPKISKKCYKPVRQALSTVRNLAMLYFFLPREYEKIMDFHRLSELWQNLNRISQKLLEGKMT